MMIARALTVKNNFSILKGIPMHLGGPHNYLPVPKLVISAPGIGVGFVLSMISMCACGAPDFRIASPPPPLGVENLMPIDVTLLPPQMTSGYHKLPGKIDDFVF